MSASEKAGVNIRISLSDYWNYFQKSHSTITLLCTWYQGLLAGKDLSKILGETKILRCASGRSEGKPVGLPSSLVIDFAPPPTKKQMRDTEKHIKLPSLDECLDPPLGQYGVAITDEIISTSELLGMCPGCPHDYAYARDTAIKKFRNEGNMKLCYYCRNSEPHWAFFNDINKRLI